MKRFSFNEVLGIRYELREEDGVLETKPGNPKKKLELQAELEVKIHGF